MATVLLTYDVKKTSDTVHSELKKRLIEVYKYSPKIQANTGKWYERTYIDLLNQPTTVQTSADFIKACGEVGGTWEKHIAVDYTNATFNNQ